jgi:multisubunit Na+/H+ antiporter MnhE subunit
MRKFQTWLAWWILLTAFWLMIDDSLRADELLAGAGAAALAALLVTAVRGETGERTRPRLAWLTRTATLPGQVIRDTIIVFAALGRRLTTGELPGGGYAEVPARSHQDATRRVAATWAGSLAPGSFVVDLDPGRDVMVVHRLTAGRPEGGRTP